MSFCKKCGKAEVEDNSFCRECSENLSSIQDEEVSAPVPPVITEQDYDSFIGISDKGDVRKRMRTTNYLTRFKRFNINGIDKFSAIWHWPAFFFTFFWMIYRKLYLWASLVFVISLIPYIGIILSIGFGISGNYIYYKHVKNKLLNLNNTSFSSDAQRAEYMARHGGVSKIALLLGLILWTLFTTTILIPLYGLW